MKTMIATNSKVRRVLSLLILSTMITLFVSCNNDDAAPEPTADDQENITFDSMDDYYFEDADDVVALALESEATVANGRIISDARLRCSQLFFSGDLGSGSLTVDFGNGCEDAQGNIRKGKIVVERHGSYDTEGSHWSFTFSDYSINGVKVEGTRIATLISVTDSVVVSDVTLVGGKITWPDGSVARREANRRRHHERHENKLLDRLIIYGNAQGTWCNGRGYFIEIIEPLVYRRSCTSEGVIIPVAGKKLVKHAQREVTVDYGDGSCDSFVTLTYQNGKTIRYEVK